MAEAGEKAIRKKEREPIATVCLVVLLIASVAVLGVFINDNYISKNKETVEYGDSIELNYTGSLYASSDEVLYAFEILPVGGCYECECLPIAVGACCAANAVNVVFGITGHIEVYHHLNVVDVDATCDDVGRHKYVDLPALKAVHHLVACCLVEVGVHLATVYLPVD